MLCSNWCLKQVLPTPFLTMLTQGCAELPSANTEFLDLLAQATSEPLPSF